MEQIIEKIDRKLIKHELNKNTFIRNTNKSNNELYCVNIHNSPNILQEIGRLREIAFRTGGGGTGLPLDLDELDTCEKCYEQLIVWDPTDEEIIGGYRFILCKDARTENGDFHLSTSHLFDFSENFKTNFLPKSIELGRSFVQPGYQGTGENRKGMFSLDNLWDGLGALMVIYPDMKYFFGKVTMYPSYNPIARDHILCFLHHYFPDNENLVMAKPNLKLGIKNNVLDFEKQLKQLDYKKGHALLIQTLKPYNHSIPPLINSYMNTSPTMKTFETAINDEFGSVEETGILIDMRDIYDAKKERHMGKFDLSSIWSKWRKGN